MTKDQYPNYGSQNVSAGQNTNYNHYQNVNNMNFSNYDFSYNTSYTTNSNTNQTYNYMQDYNYDDSCYNAKQGNIIGSKDYTYYDPQCPYKNPNKIYGENVSSTTTLPMNKGYSPEAHQEYYSSTNIDFSSMQNRSLGYPNGSNICEVSSQTTLSSSRRQRHTFNSEQTLILESAYKENKYVCRMRRVELAREINVSEGKIKTWFQNRRMKDKKEKKSNDTSLSNYQSNIDATNQLTSSNISVLQDTNVQNQQENYLNPQEVQYNHQECIQPNPRQFHVNNYQMNSQIPMGKSSVPSYQYPQYNHFCTQSGGMLEQSNHVQQEFIDTSQMSMMQQSSLHCPKQSSFLSQMTMNQKHPLTLTQQQSVASQISTLPKNFVQ